MFLLNLLIFWPKRIASYIEPFGPLIVRIVVGYTFMLTGWAKLQNLISGSVQITVSVFSTVV